MGTASMKVTATWSGTPFATSLRTIGTVAQSQTGSARPSREAASTPRMLLRGMILAIVRSETYKWIAADRRLPMRRNGRASTVMARIVIESLSRKAKLWGMTTYFTSTNRRAIARTG